MKILITSILTIISQFAHGAENWPRFRGPMGSGEIPAGVALPKEWSPASAKWAAKLAGVGHSSPVIWERKIFVTSAGNGGATRTLQCFDLHKGDELWKREIKSAKHKRHKFNSYATSTPAVDADHVYLLWGQPDRVLVIAYSHTGEEKWRKNLGKYKSGHGFGVSPIAADGKLIIANDQEAGNAIVALDTKTGEIAWTSKRSPKRATYSTPNLFPHDNADTEVIVTDWQQGITAIDLTTGKQRWTRSVFDVDDKQRAISSPIIWDDLIIATCGFAAGNRRLVAIKNGSDRPTLAFQLDDYIPHVPTPLAHDGRLYLWSESGIVSCYELPSGEPLYERERVPARGKFFSSPIVIAGHIVNFSNDGDVIVLKAGDEFKLITEAKLPEPTQATPAAADGH
ncbi:MAG: outer membrane protein assembly factor BamB, partial [Verrucomicrobiales bacterium]